MEQGVFSDKIAYKGHKKMDRSDAIEIQHPDDWFYVPLFGLERQQQSIERAIAPFLKPNISSQIQRILPKGVILQGLPGTGKTTLVKNISKKFGVPLVVMRADRILNLYLGESEKRVAEVFKIVNDFKKCIIFIDDGEALFPRRDMHNAHHTFRTMEQVLFSEIDNLNPTKTQIIIATNKIDMLDPALISRVSLTLDFEKPKLSSIKSILNEYLNEIEHDEKLSLSKEIIAEKLLDHDGREITGIIGSAICNSLVNNSNCLTLGDMLTSLEERNIISHGDANLISERVIIKISSDSKSLTKDKTEYNRQEAITRGRKKSFQIQRLWNSYQNKLTFVTGKYAKILLELEKYKGFNCKLIELKSMIEKSTNEKYSKTVFCKILSKYKELGLIDYSSSSPIEIKESMNDILSYIDSLSEDKMEALSLLEKKLKEQYKDIQKGPLKKDLKKNGLSIDMKKHDKPKKKYGDLNKGHKDIQKGLLKKDLKKSRKGRKKKRRDDEFSRITSIQDFMTSGKKLPTDEITNKSREFLNKLHNESTKLRQSREGAKSIFQGKLYYQILESLDECEGKTKRDFYTYLVKKYKRKNHTSYQTYFPHLKHLNLVKEKDGILKLEPTGIQLISYIKEYGLDNILEWIPKKD